MQKLVVGDGLKMACKCQRDVEVVALHKLGLPAYKVADLCGVSRRTVYSIVRSTTYTITDADILSALQHRLETSNG